MAVKRQRVRRDRDGSEVELPSIKALRDPDPMSMPVAEQIVIGVSTRRYDRSLDPVHDAFKNRGTSKSNASRALIDRTTQKRAEFVDRNLADLDLVAMFIDGIAIPNTRPVELSA